MAEQQRGLRDELKKKIKDAVTASSDTSNIASAIHIGGAGRRTGVSTRQRVVQRDGVTTKVTETREEKGTGGATDGPVTYANAEQHVDIAQGSSRRRTSSTERRGGE